MHWTPADLPQAGTLKQYLSFSPNCSSLTTTPCRSIHPSSDSSNQGHLSLDQSQTMIIHQELPPPPGPRGSITTTETRRVRSTFTHMSSWIHQTLSSRGKGDSKTCQAGEREAACFQGQECWGHGREARMMNTRERRLSSLTQPWLQRVVQASG